MADGEDVQGDEVYQPDGSEVQDDEGLLPPEDTLDGPVDPLDRGYSPPEKPWAVEHTGTTAEEQRLGETLDERLAKETPDLAPDPVGDGLGDTTDTDGELLDAEVGGPRAGRLIAPDEGAHGDEEKDLVATDVGIDSAAASAEEAAVHIVEEPEEADEREDGGGSAA